MYVKELAVLLLAAALVASASDSPQTPEAARAVKADYTLTINTAQAEFKSGLEIPLEITARNVSNHPMSVWTATKQAADADQGYWTSVWDESGQLAPETKHGRWVRTRTDDPGETTVFVGSGVPGTLQPGATHRDAILLNRLYDLSQPGKHTVQVRTWGDGAGKVLSNKITITITK